MADLLYSYHSVGATNRDVFNWPSWSYYQTAAIASGYTITSVKFLLYTGSPPQSGLLYARIYEGSASRSDWSSTDISVVIGWPPAWYTIPIINAIPNLTSVKVAISEDSDKETILRVKIKDLPDSYFYANMEIWGDSSPPPSQAINPTPSHRAKGTSQVLEELSWEIPG